MQSDFDPLIAIAEEHGIAHLGLMTNESWQTDPRRLVFTLSRYKFVAKMLEGLENVLEIGCGDGFGSRIVAQAVCKLTAIETDPILLDSALSHLPGRWPINYRQHDLLDGQLHDATNPARPARFDAIYAIDVLEHVEPADQELFLNVTCSMLPRHGLAIIGMPSLESQPHASPQSKAGHVNCQSGPELKFHMSRHFHQVLCFSMNDEVVHTGFHKMAHYLWAIGVCPRHPHPYG